MDMAVVTAAVKEDTGSVFASVADRVAEDVEVVAPLRGDDACWCGAVATHDTGFQHETNGKCGRQDGRYAPRISGAAGRERLVRKWPGGDG